MPEPRIVAFAGSLRTDSYNKRLARLAAAAAERAGADVTLLDLRELALPLFDEDLEREHGMPPGARRFKEALVEADGLLIASPEYNGGPSGALKNAIDWASRTHEPGEPPLRAFKGKVAGLMAASPGHLGGLRSLIILRTILSGLQVLVLPNQRALPAADKAFAADGSLASERDARAIEDIANEVVEYCRRLEA